jgi:hypothetical protein
VDSGVSYKFMHVFSLYLCTIVCSSKAMLHICRGLHLAQLKFIRLLKLLLLLEIDTHITLAFVYFVKNTDHLRHIIYHDYDYIICIIYAKENKNP